MLTLTWRNWLLGLSRSLSRGRRSTSSDPAGTMETPVEVPAGTGQANYHDCYSPQQAGDLSGIHVDPNDGSFWAVTEFANTEATANWGTAIANFTLGSTPLPHEGHRARIAPRPAPDSAAPHSAQKRRCGRLS